jgi:probable HAF family extracellular repeat protein
MIVATLCDDSHHGKSTLPRVAYWECVTILLVSVTTTFGYGPYRVTEIPGTSASAINSYGQVTGWTNVGSELHAFLWTPTVPNGTSGSQIDLGDFPGGLFEAEAFGINASGQVVGYSNVAQGGHAFLWSPTTPNGTTGSMVDLGLLPNANSSIGFGINGRGQVAGYSVVMSQGPRAFLWTPSVTNGSSGTMIDLGALSGGNGTSEATAINNLGQIAGFSQAPSTTHAVLWSPPNANGVRMLTDISPIPSGNGVFSFPDGMNELGYLAGHSTGGSGSHGILWVPTTPNASVGTSVELGAIGSEVVGVSNIGDAVGFSGNVARIWPHEGGIIDLNTLLDPITGSGWQLAVAVGINDQGQITGYGTHSGVPASFLLTPVPEPSGAAILIVGISVLVVQRIRPTRTFPTKVWIPKAVSPATDSAR